MYSLKGNYDPNARPFLTLRNKNSPARIFSEAIFEVILDSENQKYASDPRPPHTRQTMNKNLDKI